MPVTHTVRQGEHLSSIAARYGFRDFHEIWEHAANAGLKSKRKNPNVLLPGDLLHIPDKQPKTVSIPTTRLHIFRIPSPKLLLRIQLLQRYSSPIANTPCELAVDTQKIDTNSDTEGKVEQSIPVTAKKAHLLVHHRVRSEQGDLANDFAVEIHIGELDPVEERSGQEARLANLGYYVAAIGDADEGEFQSAVEEFQCEHDLVVDGICGPRTQAKLLEAHGC